MICKNILTCFKFKLAFEETDFNGLAQQCSVFGQLFIENNSKEMGNILGKYFL
jgi:hypothetical protein